MDGPRLSLILPAYNEEAGLRQAIAEADECLGRLCADYEILVVDDGSQDQTAEIARQEAARRPAVRVLSHAHNLGYGAALKTGFAAARFDLVGFTDADCQFHLDDLGPLLEQARQAPVVVGHRVDRQDPWRRKFLSRGYNWLARLLLGTTVRDIDCALKVFHRDALQQILPEANNFFVNTEMLTRASRAGLTVAEVGVRHRPRLHGQSSVSLREVPRTLGRLLPFWWSVVAFPTHQEAPLEATTSGLTPGQMKPGAGWQVFARETLALTLLLLVASLLFFSRLRAPLLEPQEGRYAEIPRQMLLSGEWIVPTYHGQAYLDKPPLFYWAVMASYQIFGVHDTSARLVPALAGLLTVLLTYLWGRRLFGSRVGLCAALVLCALPAFIYRERMLTFDALLALWVVASLAAAHVALLDRWRWTWWLVSALACALGLLTKGPVALVLVCVPVFALAWLDRRLAFPGFRAWGAYLGVCLLVAGPWYLAISLLEPEFGGYFFLRHNVLRFVRPFDHAGPIWYYVPGLIVGLLPWTLLVPGLIARLRQPGRPANLGFVLVALGWMLLFFSLAGSKRPTYLLPAFPLIALALGWYLREGVDRWRSATTDATLGAVVVLAATVGLAVTAGILEMIGLPEAIGLAVLSLGVLAGLALLRQKLAWSATGALTLMLLFVGIREFLPGYHDLYSLRGRLRRLALVQRQDRPLVCYPQRYESLTFYLPTTPVRVFGAEEKDALLQHLESHPGTLLLVKSGPVLERFLAELPPSLEFRIPAGRTAVVIGQVVPRAEVPGRWLTSESAVPAQSVHPGPP